MVRERGGDEENWWLSLVEFEVSRADAVDTCLVVAQERSSILKFVRYCIC